MVPRHFVKRQWLTNLRSKTSKSSNILSATISSPDSTSLIIKSNSRLSFSLSDILRYKILIHNHNWITKLSKIKRNLWLNNEWMFQNHENIFEICFDWKKLTCAFFEADTFPHVFTRRLIWTTKSISNVLQLK
jgi:hypothetical protein